MKKRKHALTSVFIGMFFILACQNQADSTAGHHANRESDAKISNTDLLDFGRVRAGTILEGTFQFVNQGKTNLEIESIRPGCGCTVVESEKMVYAPGETIQVPFKLKTAGYKGPTQKVIYVTFKDHTIQQKQLMIRADLFEEIGMSRRYVVFRNVAMEEGRLEKEMVYIFNNSPNTIKYKGARTDLELVTIHPQGKKIKSNDSLAVEIHLHPLEPMNKYGRVYFELETGETPPPKLSMSVYINIKEE